MTTRAMEFRRWLGAAAESPGADQEVKWFACYTRARHEKRVASLLAEREIDHYLPLIRETRQWHDRRKVVELPLFPGYLFVRIAPSQLFDVTCVQSVVNVVASDGRPAEITAEEIENVVRFVTALNETGTRPERQPAGLTAGDRVVVTAGPFKDVEGVVEKDGGSRVIIGLEAIGQGFVLNVPVANLRLLSQA